MCAAGVVMRRGLMPGTSSPSPSRICRSCRRVRTGADAGRRWYSGSNSGSPGIVPPSPLAPPAAGVAALSSRRLISVSGPDAPKYLQGVITSNIFAAEEGRGGHAPQTNGRPRDKGFYTGFLSAQGRVLHDVFVYPDTVSQNAADELGQSFLIEVDADEAQTLERHIRRYKLRAKFDVRLVDEGELGVWHAWDDGAGGDVARGGGGGGGGGRRDLADASTATSIRLRDPRTPTLGWRLVTAGGAPLPPELDHLERADEGAYQVRRYLLGVPEGQRELLREQALPLESNMDVMGGIDFRKGCYVGQELTIRTRHRGVVRKRVLPCVVYPPEEGAPAELAYRPYPPAVAAQAVPPETSIGRVGKKGRSAGKWLRGVGNVGLALCRLETMTDVAMPGETGATGTAAFDPAHDEFVMTWGGGGEGEGEGEEGKGPAAAASVKVKAFVPEWLRRALDEQAASSH